MLKKIICSIVALMLISNYCVFAADFMSSAQFEISGKNKYKAIRLTPEIYGVAKRNLADIILYNKNNEVVPYFINSLKNADAITLYPKFTVGLRGKNTVVKVSGLKNVKLTSISIETDKMFKRKVLFEGGTSKVLYNLLFRDMEYKDVTLPLNEYKVKSGAAELIIQNGDDIPININKIVVTYLADELVFVGSSGGSYSIYFGNTDIALPPSYDIVNYKEKIISEGYDLLQIKEIKTQPTQTPVPQYDYKWIFDLVIVVVAVVLGVLIFLKLKRN